MQRSNLADPTTSRRYRKRKSREVPRPFFSPFSALRGEVSARYREDREVGGGNGTQQPQTGSNSYPLEARKPT
jgi:hypothetical protein